MVNSRARAEMLVALPKLSHEGRQLSKGHGGVMPNSLARSMRRQPHAVLNPLAHALNALLYPSRSLRLLGPDRRQRLGDLSAVDCRDWSISVGAWRSRAGCSPIAGGVSRSSRCSDGPPGTCATASLKIIRSAVCCLRLVALLALLLDWVIPSRSVCRAPLARSRASASDTVCRAPGPSGGLAMKHVAEEPCLGPDLERLAAKAMAVAIAAGGLQPFHLKCS